MAVMTSMSPDIVAHDQRHPVPSDKMALDLDINGTSNHDEQSRDLAVPDSSMTSMSDLASKQGAETMNGIPNSDAFELNQAIAEPITALFNRKESDLKETDETFSTDGDVVDAPRSFTTQQPSTQNKSLDLPQQPHSFIEEQLDAIVALPPANSSVPPIVEAQESDLRDEISPVTEAQANEMMAEKHNLDLIIDSSPAVTSGDSSFNDANADSNPVVSAIDDTQDLLSTSPLDEQPLHPQSVSNIDLNQTSQPDLPNPTESTTADINMMDAPPSPSKASRAREEDHDEEPSAKRTKTEGESASSDFAMPDTPASAINGSIAPAPGDDLAATAYQVKEILKAVRQQKNTNNGKNFRDSVAALWPLLASAYAEKIKNPVDLLIIENRLKDGGYATLGDFKNDLNLLYENCIIYNGADHTVTKAAEAIRMNIISKIPGPEPVKAEKPRKSTPLADPLPRAAARRQSSHTRPRADATSPTAAAPAQTFALNPSGTPLIRRDSTKNDTGRPKREIHPPKNKDLIYNARPKKKFAQELKFCDEILNEMRKPKYGSFNQQFLNPVDPVALGIPDYFRIIKSPMDLSTVANKLTNGEITSAKDFESDVRLIFKNCYKFNPEGSAVNLMGKKLEELFDQEWAKKSQWVADHPSPNNATSPFTASESEAEESDEEPEQPAAGSSTAALQARLIEEQNKLIGMLAAKDSDPALEQLQRDFIAIIQQQVDKNNKDAAKAAKSKPKTKVTKKSAPAAKKKAEPVKKAYRVKQIGMTEKEQISEGIAQLEGKDMDAAIGILKKDIPSLVVDGEEELDIDQFSNKALSELHDLVLKRVPGLVPTKAEPVRQQKQSRPKKNKPMSKHEQEAKIEKLKALEAQFDGRQGSGTSDDATTSNVMQTVEEDSGDESPSDSEED